MAFDVLDPDAYTTQDCTLSAGGLRVKVTGQSYGATPITFVNGHNLVICSQTGKSASKLYLEWLCNSIATDHSGIGVVGACTAAGALQPGGGANHPVSWQGVCFFDNNIYPAGVYANGIQYAGAPNWGSGALISHCIDLDNGGTWFSLDGTNYFGPGSGGNTAPGNPAANTNPFPLTNPAGDAWSNWGPCYPCVSIGGNADFTVNMGATAFARTPPAGFSGWTQSYVPLIGSLQSSITGSPGGAGKFVPANHTGVSKYVALATGTIVSLQIAFAGDPGGARRAVIYDASGPGGGPGNLIARSGAAISGGGFPYVPLFTYPFSPSVAITKGTTYYLGYDTDTTGGTDTGFVAGSGPNTGYWECSGRNNATFGALTTTANYRMSVLAAGLITPSGRRKTGAFTSSNVRLLIP